VHLVGAGPGAADLVTVRGRARLEIADVVIHDRLVSPTLLALVPPGVQILDVGKPSRLPRRAGATIDPQPQISALLVEHARQGKVVVRLKGGDPFVFGRGGEEADACRAAGIPCEVVPGVSSALAAPAAAGIPVTERGIAGSFTVRTARHGESGSPRPAPAFAADTEVVLMGVEALAEIAGDALAAGRAPETPAAVIASATLPHEQVVFAPLAGIAHAAARAGVAPPAVLVFGDVVRHAATRRDGRLPGRPRVALTRPQGAARRTEAHLAARGFDVVSAPLLSIEYLDPAEIAPRLTAWSTPAHQPGHASGASWIAFTSRHGVEGWWRGVRALGRDARSFAGDRFAVVGPGTAAALAEHGISADLVATPHRGAALVGQLAAAARATGDRVVRFASGTRARRELIDGLNAAGLSVDEVAVYRTRLEAPPDSFRRALDAGVDAVVFASPSAAESFAAHHLPGGEAVAVCLGPTTARAVCSLGFERVVVAQRHDEIGLVEEVVRAVAGAPTRLRTAGVRS
jgi:uroporphyrinogen III methyltransferase/synthase